MPLTVVFLNTWGGSLYALHSTLYKRFMRQLGVADVIFFSEVHSYHRSRPKFVYPKNPGHRVGPVFVRQYQWLCQLLAATHYGHFTPQLRGLHDLEAHALDIEYGIAVFVKRSLLSVYTYREGFAYRSYGKFNDGLPSARSIHEIVLELPKATIACYHFHGLWDANGKCDTPERMEQTNNVVSFMETFRPPTHRPCVRLLGGDFNLTSDCGALEELRAAAVFGPSGGINWNHRCGCTSTRTAWYNKPNKPLEADFIITSENATGCFRIDRTAPSDHAALWFELAV